MPQIKIWTAYEAKIDARKASLIECEQAVGSVRGLQEQHDIVRSYHLGKTNYRGVNETGDIIGPYEVEEEDDYMAAKEDASSWTRVEKRGERRQDRGRERRAPRQTPQQRQREQPARNQPSGEQRRERPGEAPLLGVREYSPPRPPVPVLLQEGSARGRSPPTPGTYGGECSEGSQEGSSSVDWGPPVLQLRKRNRTVVAHVMDWASSEYEAILGTNALRSVAPSKCSLSATGRARHEIVISDNRVVHVKPRRYPQLLTEVEGEEVRNLLAQGIIRKSVPPYYSPLWVGSKPLDTLGNPHYQVEVDFKELNKYTCPKKYPLPRLEEMLDSMNGASVFSLLDLKARYHQIRMHEADCEKTAFQFGRGKYDFTRMPFGLRNAPKTFQHLMDEFLEGLNKDAIQFYLDYIIVFSCSEQEHGRHLRHVLKRLKEIGLKASDKKSFFFHA
ncbi:hypothetical protein AAG570_011910 [Ranatra chinensis]|uniref:Reverse transcriptase domain-containing protein n=1 Tax=Ranatra chinensis TaxID=642074 RepID=A0ABD0YHA4_9HEMI